jgi:hypothetical protein
MFMSFISLVPRLARGPPGTEESMCAMDDGTGCGSVLAVQLAP